MSYRDEAYHLYSGINFTEHSGTDFSKYSLEDLKKLWNATLKQGMHGICFSMYEDGQQPGDKITEAQVERRVKILKPYTKWIRSFSCIEGNEHVPKMAKKHGLKTLVGAWLSDNKADNEKEIEGLIQLAKEGVVDIAAVGNEVLYRNELTLDELLGYIKRVKKALPNTPVGYVDAYYEFSVHPELVAHSDIILSNCYPYWEGTHIDGALGHMQHMYAQVESVAQGKLILITETGWPSEGGSLKSAFSSEENAIKYFINTQAWAKKANIKTFYFSSFDESWKTGDEGDVGAYWGLWDKHEKLKF
ncbi:glycosyl hydrolase family 17 protein [Lacinutrix sp.]|uniref:glycoside hydrolase family 17 protein n=1 Tax=Lacinutrix sp. TaxID=1937692 RepID=UPI00262D2969|nr:glycosyl hydrolase family 17 protein [Lacinutrix sp.]MDG1714913.1 glycosyl hydrolase family 17 protein [Lacinutrix sp.]